MNIGKNIKLLRNRKNISQEKLAEHLNVSFQAVSKWENHFNLPDISLLPKIAEFFNVSIDALFSEDALTYNVQEGVDNTSLFPWEDDDIIRGVVCHGRRILHVSENLTGKFTFEFVGDAKSVRSECDLTINGSVSGDCSANGDVIISGDLSGKCQAGDDVAIGGDFSGFCDVGDDVTFGGEVNGEIASGSDKQK